MNKNGGAKKKDKRSGNRKTMEFLCCIIFINFLGEKEKLLFSYISEIIIKCKIVLHLEILSNFPENHQKLHWIFAKCLFTRKIQSPALILSLLLWVLCTEISCHVFVALVCLHCSALHCTVRFLILCVIRDFSFSVCIYSNFLEISCTCGFYTTRLTFCFDFSMNLCYFF